MAGYIDLLNRTMLMTSNGKRIRIELTSDFETPEPPKAEAVSPESSDMSPAERNACWMWSHAAKKPNVVKNIMCRVRGMGMNYRHYMSVCRQIVLERVSAFVPGRRIDLPLTADFVVEKIRIDDGFIPTSPTGLWQLESRLDQSLLVAFAYRVTDGGVEPLTQSEITQLGSHLVPGGDTPAQQVDCAVEEALKVKTGPLRILVFFSVTFCKERPDFEPGGVLGVNRIYPHAMIVASQRLESVEADIVVERSSTTPHAGAMPDPLRPESISPQPLMPVDSMLATIRPILFADHNVKGRVPPFWDQMFDYYELDPAANGVGFAVPLTMVDPSKTAIRSAKLVRRGIEANLDDVLKVPRQGEFDNLHLAPPMAVGPPPLASGLKTGTISMAPFCVHDCLHMHTRWGLLGDHSSGSTKGFDANGTPYRTEGGPLVPHNQNVSLKLLAADGQIGYRYSVSAFDASPGSWTVCFHHGIGYANDLWGKLDRAIVALARFAAEANAVKSGEHIFAGRTAENSWATFYWRLRFGGVPGVPVERMSFPNLAAARAL